MTRGVENLANDLLPSIKKYICNEECNIKITIGKCRVSDVKNHGIHFDKKLFNETNFIKMKNLLESCKEWDNIVDVEIVNSTEIPKKIFYSTVINFHDSPYDIVIEAESSEKEEKFISADYKENKIIYDRKHHIYEIYKITNEFKTDYSFSIILKNVNGISEKYLLHSTLLKIEDMINSCENIGENLKEYTITQLENKFYTC